MKPQLDTVLCTACHACVSVCPATCITMEKDELGFLRPHVDEKACLECGLCVKTCEKVKEIPVCANRRIYAAKHTQDQIVKSSSSGGVFTALSDIVLAMGGVIVGARYGQNMRVEHALARTPEERDALCGSKYTYSLCDKRIYAQVRQLLEDGVPVLFSGTPCQVAALKTFLGKSYAHLYLADILCHGIAAPALYRDYLSHLEAKNGPIAHIDFRHAPGGNWHTPRTYVTYENGKRKSGEEENSYYRMFVSYYCLRESCYSCNYAQFDRISDITMGDFWGIESCHPEFDLPDGVSVVMTNTQKGAELFEQAKEKLITMQCVEADCTHEQLNGLKEGNRNEAFVSDYLHYGYAYIHQKYTATPISIRIREKLYRIKAIRTLRDAIKGR